MTSPHHFPESLLAQALATLAEGSLITDAHQNTLYVNEAFTTMTGYTYAEMVGQNCRMLQGPETNPATVTAIHRALTQGDIFRGDILNYRKDKRPFWNALTITPLRDAAGQITHFASIQRDITAQRTFQEQLQFQALHDSLTGLPNRLAFSQHLTKALARSTQSGSPLLVGVIDLDDFKAINDTFGHIAADSLLQEFGTRVRTRMRTADIVARLGGDEFVVVIEDLDRDQIVLTQLIVMMQRLHQAIDTPFDIAPNQTVHIQMSMGLALAPWHGNESDQLLRKADAALYQAKIHKSTRDRWWRLFEELNEPIVL